MPEEQFLANGTFASSKQPRLELIPYEAEVRFARRFELGIERKGDKAWNALSRERNWVALTDKATVLERCGHVIHHARRLTAILSGEIQDDGDDHAAAIGWGACFLACATAALKQQKNCSACGGTGTWTDKTTDPCPACQGSGKERAK